jgi:nitrilase
MDEIWESLSRFGKDGDKKWSRGGSCIVSPLGIVLAGPLWDKEGIITAEVRLC